MFIIVLVGIAFRAGAYLSLCHNLIKMEVQCHSTHSMNIETNKHYESSAYPWNGGHDLRFDHRTRILLFRQHYMNLRNWFAWIEKETLDRPFAKFWCHILPYVKLCTTSSGQSNLPFTFITYWLCMISTSQQYFKQDHAMLDFQQRVYTSLVSHCMGHSYFDVNNIKYQSKMSDM